MEKQPTRRRRRGGRGRKRKSQANNDIQKRAGDEENPVEHVTTVEEQLQHKHFPLLEGFSESDITRHAQKLLSDESQRTRDPHPATPSQIRVSLNSAQMTRSDLLEWYEYLRGLELDIVLRRWRTGRRYLRYIVNCPFQYHFGCVMLYIGAFDFVVERSNRQDLFTKEELQRLDAVRKERNAFCHGDERARALDKEEFEWMVGVVKKHERDLQALVEARPIGQ